MTVTRYANNFYQGLAADTKPTNVPAGAIYRATDTGDIYHYNGSSWDLIVGASKTETLTNKTIAAGSNTISGIVNANIDAAAAIATSKLADAATLLTTINTKTVSNKTLLDSVNTIGIHVPYTFTIYQTGSNYIVRNNYTGALESFSNSDFSPVLEWAIDNVVNVTGGISDSSVTGGAIFIQRGIYTATTNLAVDIDTATRHGITVEGEGLGTQIYFNPDSGSPLTDGITVDMMGFGLRHMRIRANEYVTNIIHHIGHASGRKNSHYKYEYLMIEGPNGDAGNSGAPTNISGQKGIFIDGTDLASYHGTVHGCEFIALETGLDLYDNQATSCKVISDVFWCCEYAIIIEEGSGQNFIDNVFIQGDTTVGTTGIWIKGGGANTVISNVVTELQRENPPATEVDCRAILLDTGVQDIYIVNVNNVFDGIHSLAKTVVDNSGNFTNSHQSHLNVGDTNFIRFQTSDSTIRFNTSRLALFANAQIYIADSDGTHNYVIKGGDITGVAGPKNVTIPAISANSNFVLDDTTQTLTNKSISGSTNTFSSIPDSALSANVALENTANVFTTAQEIQHASTEGLLNFYRSSNTALDKVGMEFSFNNSTPAETVYTAIQSQIVTNTAGAENGQLVFQTKAAGTLANRMILNHNGNLFIGTNARLVLTDTGLTASRTMTFPNEAATLVGTAVAQTLTNKTISDLKETWQSKSTTYTMANTDYGIICTGTGTYTITLNAAATAGAGRIYQFLKTGASGTVTIDGDGAETINGTANTTLTAQYQTIKLLCDGSAWFIIT